MQGSVAAIATVIAITLSPTGVRAAESLAHHGTFRDWQVFRLDNQNLTLCYAATEASRYHPRTNNRARPILYIVRYPKTTSTNTLEIRFGGHISDFQAVTAKVVARRRPAHDKFPLTIKRESGFVTVADDQHHLIKAMEKGRQLLIVSQPGVGDILEDRYSLFGYSAAVAKLESLCPGPLPKAPVVSDTTPPAGNAGDTASRPPTNAPKKDTTQ